MINRFTSGLLSNNLSPVAVFAHEIPNGHSIERYGEVLF